MENTKTILQPESWQSLVSHMDATLQIEKNYDIIKRSLNLPGRKGALYMIDGLFKDDVLERMVQFLLTMEEKQYDNAQSAEAFADRFISYSEVLIENDEQTILKNLLSGAAVLFVEPFSDAIIIDARTYPARAVAEPNDERVLRGSHDGFVETLVFNTALLRRRIRDTDLVIEAHTVGKRSKTDVAIAYLHSKVDHKFLKNIRDTLANLNVNSLTMAQESLNEALTKKGWYNPFPKVRYTERPDNTAAALAEGLIAIFIDNSSSVMLLPVNIFQYLQEGNDFCFPPVIGGYLRIIRMVIFITTIFLTPVWFYLTQNPELIPEWLSFIAIEEPNKVPVLAQLLIFEFAIEGLKLASLNTPVSLGTSFSIIGALIFGDFAVQAHWLVPEVIMYMGLVAIGNYTQPSYELGYALKLMRVSLLIGIALFNLWGFIGVLIIYFVLMATNKTPGGKSFLYPLIPFNGKALKNVLLRKRMNNENS